MKVDTTLDAQLPFRMLMGMISSWAVLCPTLYQRYPGPSPPRGHSTARQIPAKMRQGDKGQNHLLQTSLGVQWLMLWRSNLQVVGSIPGRARLRATQDSQNRQTKKHSFPHAFSSWTLGTRLGFRFKSNLVEMTGRADRL